VGHGGKKMERRKCSRSSAFIFTSSHPAKLPGEMTFYKNNPKILGVIGAEANIRIACCIASTRAGPETSPTIPSRSTTNG
jgi:hypothetical protein